MGRFNSFKMVPIFFAVVVIISVTIFLGQVLGKYYLGNMQGQVLQEDLVNKGIPSRGNAGEINKKKKVLRLKEVNYYTILVTTVEQQDEALRIGQELGKQGFPVVITGGDSYRILLGLLNNEEKLAPLAQRIKVGESGAQVISEKLNKVAFKFEASNTFAAEKIAPFLGKISLCLEKGILLYHNIGVTDAETSALAEKYLALAASLEEAANEGEQIAEETDPGWSGDVKNLAQLCKEWAYILRLLVQQGTDLTLLKGQQQGLALLEEYHRFVLTTN